MEERLQLALEESSKNLQLPIKAEHAKYGNVEGKNPKNKCIACITSGGIHIREEAKSVKLKSSYIWYDLTKIAINIPLLQLTFRQREKAAKKENSDSDSEILVLEILEGKSKNQKENNSNFQTFMQYLSDTLQRVLTPFELKRISFYSSVFTERVKPTFVSIMSRLSMILPFQKYPMSQISIVTLKTMLFSHQPVFNLSTFKDSENVIPIIFELFPLIDYVDVVKIPEVNNFPVYKASSYFLFQLNCIKYIEIAGPKDDGFDSFLQRLPKSNIRTISYSFSKFSTQDLELISSSILDSNIHCIEFHDAINDNDKTSFYNNFLDSKMCAHIWSLNLNNTNNLNLPILLQKLSDISSLSLAYCNVEINSTIRLIHESKMKYLKYLNLSGNLCNETLDMSIKLPKNLTHIMVNDVSWNDKSLTSFISLVLQLSKNEKNQKMQQNQVNKKQKQKELYLSISHAITLQHEWSRLFQLLHFNYSTSSMNVSFLQFRNSSHSSYNFSELRNAISNEDDDEERFYPVTLRSLAWDENPVDPSFFDFLKECKELETLSLNSCFHETLESSLALFVEYIKANNSLKQLFVAGSKKVHLGKKVIKVIEACLDKKNLKVIDLSISKCDSSCLKEFIPLFDAKRSSLDVVILDGIFPSDAETFLGFLNQIKLMNSKTKISFPSGDCLNLKKQKKMNQKQMNDINSIYKSIDPSNSTRKDSFDINKIVKFIENDEEKSSSSTHSSNTNSSSANKSNSNSNNKNIIKVKPLKHSEFLKQPYYYKYFYEPFIPYYIELDEVNEIRSQKYEEEPEEQENENNNEIENKEAEINKNENENENENDNFTLLQVEDEFNEEEEEEEADDENNVNKTFTIHLADFESNINEEEEEEEFNELVDLNEEEDLAIPVDFNNSINIIQNMQKALIDRKEIENNNNNNHDSLSIESPQKNIVESSPLVSQANQRLFADENEYENEEEEEEVKVNIQLKNQKIMKPKSPQRKKNVKQIKKKVLNKEEIVNPEDEQIETETKPKRKLRQKGKQLNRNRSKRPIKQIKKKIVNKNNDKEEEEIENETKINKRNVKPKRKQQVIKRKRQTKQIKKKIINKIINENEEEEEIETENKNIKNTKQKSPPKQNRNRNRRQIRKKVQIVENENENENGIENKSRKNIKTKKTVQTNVSKKQIKEIKKSPTYYEEEDYDIQNDENSQNSKSDVSTSFDDSFEKTEVDDTIMNVTVGANNLHEYDDFETYETYELNNQFTTPRQAKGSNLNRNVSKNKNKNIQNKKIQIKNKQNTNKKQIKKSDDNIDDNDYDENENNADYKLSPKKQSLINNFSVQYNLNDFDFIFHNFEPVLNNSEIWTNMNEEFSINKLFNNVKVIKEASS